MPSLLTSKGRRSLLYGAVWQLATGRHYYVATSCLHDDHAYCQNTAGQAGPKQPASCKFCGTACRCRCHK